MMRSTVIFLFLTFAFIFVVSYDTWITKSHISNLVFIMFIPAMIAGIARYLDHVPTIIVVEFSFKSTSII